MIQQETTLIADGQMPWSGSVLYSGCDLKSVPFFVVRALLIGVCWTSVGQAEGPTAHLIWERPVGSLCPTRAALQADVEQTMGRRVFRDDHSAHVTVRGVIEDSLDGAHVQIEARAADGTHLGTRQFSAPAGHCDELRGAIALVLTLFLERGDEAGPMLQEEGETHIGFGASAAVLSTPLPRATVAGGPSLSLEFGQHLRVRADGAIWFPVVVQTARGTGATLNALSLALRLCVRPWASTPIRLLICAGGEGGALIATPLQLVGPERQTRLLAHGLLDMRLEARLGTFALLDLAAGPLVTLSRPAFSYKLSDGGLMPVYQPTRFGFVVQMSFVIVGS